MYGNHLSSFEGLDQTNQFFSEIVQKAKDIWMWIEANPEQAVKGWTYEGNRLCSWISKTYERAPDEHKYYVSVEQGNPTKIVEFINSFCNPKSTKYLLIIVYAGTHTRTRRKEQCIVGFDEETVVAVLHNQPTAVFTFEEYRGIMNGFDTLMRSKQSADSSL